MSTYHRFSNAILVSAQKPITATIPITHFSNVVPKNCWITPINDNGNVIIKNIESVIPQNLFNLIGIIWLAIKAINILITVIIIELVEICW